MDLPVLLWAVAARHDGRHPMTERSSKFSSTPKRRRRLLTGSPDRVTQRRRRMPHGHSAVGSFTGPLGPALLTGDAGVLAVASRVGAVIGPVAWSVVWSQRGCRVPASTTHPSRSPTRDPGIRSARVSRMHGIEARVPKARAPSSFALFPTMDFVRACVTRCTFVRRFAMARRARGRPRDGHADRLPRRFHATSMFLALARLCSRARAVRFSECPRANA
jgi:hypothetical protein